MIRTCVMCFNFLCLLIGPALPAVSAAETILQQVGVQGGVVVHIDCNDGVLTASLRAAAATSSKERRIATLPPMMRSRLSTTGSGRAVLSFW